MPLIRAGAFESLFGRNDDKEMQKQPPPRAPNMQILVPLSMQQKSRPPQKPEMQYAQPVAWGGGVNMKPSPQPVPRMMYVDYFVLECSIN